MKVGARSQIINDLFRAKKWIKAREVLLEWLKEDPEDHWAFTRLSSTYAEEGDFTKALECIENALKGKALDKKTQDMKDLAAYIKSFEKKTPAAKAKE